MCKSIIFCVAALIVSLIISRKITNHQNKGDAIKSILAGQAEVTRVKTSRAIERKDPEDFGTAFYLEVLNNGEAKVLYLQGQYLDEKEGMKLFRKSPSAACPAGCRLFTGCALIVSPKSSG